MISFLPTYFSYLAAIALSVAISIYTVRKIMLITRQRKIYDIPDDTRKIHGAGIPSLGGVGIFVGYVIMSAFFPSKGHYFMPYIMAASAILFFTGMYDDLMNMEPKKKLVAQLLAALIPIVFANIRIDSLHGLFGIEEVPYWPSVILTTLGCAFFINVFNFIDGIDGLACITAIVSLGLLGLMFNSIRHYAVAGNSFVLMGATAGLLVYNISPARIYMGDTGSMLLGFTIFIFSVLFIKMYGEDAAAASFWVHSFQAAALLIFSILLVPMFDAIRVFISRISRGRSPLRADRSHLHYYLLDAGLSHSQAVGIILSVHGLTIVIAWLLQDSPAIALAGMLSVVAVTHAVVYWVRARHVVRPSAGA